jgi:hypothetical protein
MALVVHHGRCRRCRRYPAWWHTVGVVTVVHVVGVARGPGSAPWTSLSLSLLSGVVVHSGRRDGGARGGRGLGPCRCTVDVVVVVVVVRRGGARWAWPALWPWWCTVIVVIVVVWCGGALWVL